MHTRQVIELVAAEIRSRFSKEGSGHDWFHIQRVWYMARRIAQEEGANVFVVELGALTHDIADWKFYGGDESVGPKETANLLSRFNVSQDVIDQAVLINREISFKGAGVATIPSTLEGKIVQDADRLDAIGAIGIARTFAYGGHANRIMYDPHILPVMHQTKEAYYTNSSPTVNHFYEKLLLLRDLMNTSTAKQIAQGRHDYMVEFLDRFMQEWNGLN